RWRPWDPADGGDVDAVRPHAPGKRRGQAFAGDAVIAAEQHALRARVLLHQVPPEPPPELLGELRRQLVRDEPADVVLAEDMHRDGHGTRNLRAGSIRHK